MCQILLQSLKLWRRYGDFSIFKMATAAFLDFRNFKFLTVGAVKRVRLCHLAKFRRNRSNRGRDMAIFRCFKMAAAIAKRWRPCTAKITTMEMLAGFCTHALDRSALNSARCALTRQILSDCMCFPSSLRSEKLPILPFFSTFSTLSFCGGHAQCCRDKFERGCTSIHIPLSNRTKVVSEFQSVYGEVAFKNFVS